MTFVGKFINCIVLYCIVLYCIVFQKWNKPHKDTIKFQLKTVFLPGKLGQNSIHFYMNVAPAAFSELTVGTNLISVRSICTKKRHQPRVIWETSHAVISQTQMFWVKHFPNHVGRESFSKECRLVQRKLGSQIRYYFSMNQYFNFLFTWWLESTLTVIRIKVLISNIGKSCISGNGDHRGAGSNSCLSQYNDDIICCPWRQWHHQRGDETETVGIRQHRQWFSLIVPTSWGRVIIGESS